METWVCPFGVRIKEVWLKVTATLQHIRQYSFHLNSYTFGFHLQSKILEPAY